MKLIACCMVNNAEQFLEETIHGINNRIADIDAFVFFDGAWEKSGFVEPYSTDKTIDIINKFAENLHRKDVLFSSNSMDHYWRNPSEKRNAMLKFVDDNYGDDDYYIFWFDDDEEIRFTDGRERIWMKDYLNGVPHPITLQTYAFDSSQGMLTPRFIPKNYHWHSERAMCIHDNDHKMEFDWTPGQESIPTVVNIFNKMYIVNKWNRKNRQELQRKEAYAIHENKLYERRETCNYGSCTS